MPETGNTPVTRPERRLSVFRRHRKPMLVVLMIVMIVIGDVLGTAILRLANVYTPAARSEAAFRRWDANYHHGLRPNMSCEDGGRWGHLRYTIHTNSLGFKDASPREVPLQGKRKRLLLIGDSFTEGVGVSYPETFAGILAAGLGAITEADPTGAGAETTQGIEVLNAGCVTYSPVIYRRRVEGLLLQGLQFGHLVVCIDMSDIVDEIKYYELDDAGNVQKRVEGLSEGIKQFIADNTILINFVRNVSHDIKDRFRTGDRHVVDHERSSWTREPGLWEKYGKPGLASSGHHLDVLWKMLRERNIDMTVVVYPWPDQILNAERECAQVTFWRDWTQARKVKFIDAFPAFLDAGPADEVVARYFIEKDMHWNERGHALIAEVLLSQLQP